MNRRDVLSQLESESIFVLREVAAQFERPTLLFSGGKDSALLVHLAQKAFHPGPNPFPLLHIDTGHNFPETLAFRDELAVRTGSRLMVHRVEDSIRSGRIVEETGPYPSRNAAQSVTLMDALHELKADAAIGGGRRDEEKARAKERFFSHRNREGRWEPREQRPELWDLYNGGKAPGEHFRIFPISNWTEIDVWSYIQQESIPLPSLYFSHSRPVFWKDGMWMAVTEFLRPRLGEAIEEKVVRFRTVGDATCTGAIESGAASIEEVLTEVSAARTTERGGRGDDRRSEAAMEDRKRVGYF